MLCKPVPEFESLCHGCFSCVGGLKVACVGGVLRTRKPSRSSVCPGTCRNGPERHGTVFEALSVFVVETERLQALQTLPNAANKIVIKTKLRPDRDWEDVLEKSLGDGPLSGNFRTVFGQFFPLLHAGIGQPPLQSFLLGLLIRSPHPSSQHLGTSSYGHRLHSLLFPSSLCRLCRMSAYFKPALGKVVTAWSFVASFSHLVCQNCSNLQVGTWGQAAP